MRAAAATGGVWRSLVAIGKEEGLRGYWRGNVPQVLGDVLRSAHGMGACRRADLSSATMVNHTLGWLPTSKRSAMLRKLRGMAAD